MSKAKVLGMRCFVSPDDTVNFYFENGGLTIESSESESIVDICLTKEQTKIISDWILSCIDEDE